MDSFTFQHLVGFEVFKSVSLEMTVFWDVAYRCTYERNKISYFVSYSLTLLISLDFIVSNDNDG